MKQVFWLEDIPQEIGNKFLAVTMAVKRARQLRNGAMATVKVAGRKETTIALEETFKGMLEYQVQPIEERRLVLPESVYELGDDYDIPDRRLSTNVDEVLKEEEKDFDVVSEDEEEEDIFEVEYVDDSEYDDAVDEYEEGI